MNKIHNSIFHRLYRKLNTEWGQRKYSNKPGSNDPFVIDFYEAREETNDGKGWNTALCMCLGCLDRNIALVYPSDMLFRDLICPRCYRKGTLIVRNYEENELDERACDIKIKELEEEEKNKNGKHKD